MPAGVMSNRVIGEKLESVRTLLKRYTVGRFVAPFHGTFASIDRKGIFNLSIVNVDAANSPDVANSFYSLPTFRSVMGRCYLAERGSVRFKVHLVTATAGSDGFRVGLWTAVRTVGTLAEGAECVDVSSTANWIAAWKTYEQAEGGNGLTSTRDDMGMLEFTVPDFSPLLWRPAWGYGSSRNYSVGDAGAQVVIEAADAAGAESNGEFWPKCLVYTAVGDDYSLMGWQCPPVVTHP